MLYCSTSPECHLKVLGSLSWLVISEMAGCLADPSVEQLLDTGSDGSMVQKVLQTQSHSHDFYTRSEQLCFTRHMLPGRPRKSPCFHLTPIRRTQFLRSLKDFSFPSSLKGTRLQGIYPSPMVGITNVSVQVRSSKYICEHVRVSASNDD